MTDGATPNQNSGCSEQHHDYLQRAVDACEQGDLVLGMHLYLAAYEKAVADPEVPDGMALSGLREAWNLACDLKERSMAEYVFEKLEPYLTGDEIAECAEKLQSLALDRLEEYGFSREDLEDMAEMIASDFAGGEASVVKVESISIPNAGMFGVPAIARDAADDADFAESEGAFEEQSAGAAEDCYGQDAPASDVCWQGGVPGTGTPGTPGASSAPEAADSANGNFDPPAGRQDARERGFGLASADDFNPYDLYRDYSIGKSYHAATNEGSGAVVFTRDDERARAHDEYVSAKASAKGAGAQGAEPCADEALGASAPGMAEGEIAAADAPADGVGSSGGDIAAADAVRQADDDKLAVPPAPSEHAARQAEGNAQPARAASPGQLAKKQAAGKPAARKHAKAPAAALVPAAPRPPAPVAERSTFNFDVLAGYDQAVSLMRDYGVGLQNDRGYRDFIAMLNERHGLDKAPALDTLLFRAPALEDASRFAEAVIGELGLPALRMSIEEGLQGMPVLCIMAQGNRRPRMNHAQNRFEAPAILVLEDLDMWSMPQPPENVEGIAGFMMANISRGAREAINLIQSAVEDPDVYVLATATMEGQADPFFYDLLEPMTIIDIASPDEGERAAIWAEIQRDHPSMRSIDRGELVRLSEGLARCDIYAAARDAVEEAYKAGLVQRSYLPVTPQNVFEKLAACHPLDTDEYRALEDEVARLFNLDLEHIEDLLEGGLD